MYLKEIEIQGFKSFADKTKVTFEKGVTAVVGPNGSGKSNITESLRWALGESSVKSLRGGRMPDVIFAGTETRKPLNYASVTVVLDNSDGFISQAAEEIRVERQIYRSGDNEYRIDGKKVRLRDVHDLFMDTGLGRDSFSIISQGKVEEIFNSKPEDRRAIFEEAAGVLKYKTRRKETESKLTQTQDNLDRLEDIIYELEGQIKPLEKQAQTAKRFLELDQERKDLYLDVLVAEIKANKVRLTTAEADLAEIQEALKDYYEKRQQLEEENQAIKEKRHRLARKVEEDNRTLLDVTRLLSDLERQIDLRTLESQQAATSRKEMQERIDALTAKQAGILAELEDKRKEGSALEQELLTQQGELTRLQEELAGFSQDPDQLIEQLRERIVKLMEEEVLVSNDLTSVGNQLERYAQEAASKASEFEKLKEDLENEENSFKAYESDYEAARKQVQDLLADYQSKAASRQQLDQGYRSEQNAMFDLLDQLKNKQARRSSLENIMKNHSHFYAGVKAVLQAADQIGGIVGAVSEQLTFEREYQTALEIAMGASSQHIIVEDEGAATRAIDFLKRNRSGRATFLPLTTIKGRSLPDHHRATIQGAPGFLGVASDLVAFDAAHRHIFENLLGATAIFDTVEHARSAAKAVRYQVRMVCLDGTELRTGGSYAGGSTRQNQSIFIKPELDQLVAEIADLNAVLKEKELAVAALKTQVDEDNQLLESIQSQGEAARLLEQEKRLLFEASQSRLSELRQLFELQMSASENGANEGLLKERARLEERLAKIGQEKESLNQQVEEIKQDKDAVQAQHRALTTALSSAQLAVTEKKGQKGFIDSTITRLEGDLASNQEEIRGLELLMEEREHPHQEQDIEQLKKQLEDVSSRKSALDQTLIRAKFEQEDLDGQAEDLEEQLEHSRKRNEEWIRKQAHAEAQKEKISEKLHQYLGRLIEEYQLSFEAAERKSHPLEDLQLAQARVKDLEKAIRSLGPVNIDAIEQFEEVHSRLDFLQSQRDDVLSAKELLVSTITEMNDEVKERFKATFEAIRESFQLTFRQMFGGGSADLMLTDADLLTAGVEISVQPPGKKIQSLNLMSGGEKALSALALLFSIIRVKTIPFVILDEVEAALDEANVKRFGDYLNRFDKDSQFIVVTHRKGTMAAADSIYGVTMQESGVSKIVSVKLKDLDTIEGAQ